MNNPSSAGAPEKQGKIRYAFLDELRGFMVVCMVVYHGLCLGSYTFGIKAMESVFKFFMPIEPLFAATFILLCGFCTVYSHSNLCRGLKLAAVALAVTAVTLVMANTGYINQKDLITFGILHLLAFCLIVTGLIETVRSRCKHKTHDSERKCECEHEHTDIQNAECASEKPSIRTGYAVPIAILLVLFALTYSVPYGSVGIGSLSFKIPKALCEGSRLFFLGFVDGSYYAGDYFPLIPWSLIFTVGVLSSKLCGGVLPEFFIKRRIPFLGCIGKKALLVYIVHQPVWYLIFTLTSLAAGRSVGI